MFFGKDPYRCSVGTRLEENLTGSKEVATTVIQARDKDSLD